LAVISTFDSDRSPAVKYVYSQSLRLVLVNQVEAGVGQCTKGLQGVHLECSVIGLGYAITPTLLSVNTT
jgi:hypothetical protein